MPRVCLASTVALLLALSSPLGAQETAPAPANTKSGASAKAKAPRRRTPGVYMGRRIAPVMSFEGGGAEWLMRPEREQEEQPDAMIDALKIPKGATVADVGAGVGYTSLRLAKRVGETGTVLATDVQPKMLLALAENVKAAGARNIKPIRATATATGLPDDKVDLILMVDVYHELGDPETSLRLFRKALKTGGRLVLVEFRGEDPEVPIRPEHKMTVAQVRRELEPNGFTFKESLEFLPWQHILIFEKPAEEKPVEEKKGETK